MFQPLKIQLVLSENIRIWNRLKGDSSSEDEHKAKRTCEENSKTLTNVLFYIIIRHLKIFTFVDDKMYFNRKIYIDI